MDGKDFVTFFNGVDWRLQPYASHIPSTNFSGTSCKKQVYLFQSELISDIFFAKCSQSFSGPA